MWGRLAVEGLKVLTKNEAVANKSEKQEIVTGVKQANTHSMLKKENHKRLPESCCMHVAKHE